MMYRIGRVVKFVIAAIGYAFVADDAYDYGRFMTRMYNQL